MKILLIQPSPYDGGGRPIKKKRLYFVGLALPLLAALTPKEWDVEICIETLEEVPFDTDAELIGLSSMGHGVIRTLDLAREFKARGKTVIMGGYMASLMAEEAVKYCDSVVVGDAEEVWEELLTDFQHGRLRRLYRGELKTFDPPMPRYEMLIKKKIGDFLPVQAGRGCPHSCSFCSIHCLYRKRYYRRPVSSVIRDIKAVKELGFKKFLLLDDNILANPSYLLELCGEIQKLEMIWFSQCSIEIGRNQELLQALVASGCRVLSFGLESISQKSLESMNKNWCHTDEYPELIRNIQNAGIDVSTEMVVGADGDTLDSIAQTADFIEKNKIVVPRFYILTPIPGTDYYHQLKSENRIWIKDIYSYNGAEAVHLPLSMTPQQLTEAYWLLYRKVFSLSSILSRTILRKQMLKRPLDCLLYLAVNLYYQHSIRKRIPPNIY